MANKEIIDYKDLATVAGGDYVLTQTSDETTYNAPTISSILALTPPASTSVPGIVELATSAETTAGLAVQASDTRLSDARTPTAHAASHQDGGADELVLDASQIASGALAAARLPTGTLKTDAAISATLQPVKDKDGNASVLQISTSKVQVGRGTPPFFYGNLINVAEGTSTDSSLSCVHSSEDFSTRPFFFMYRMRGTLAEPAAVQSGDFIGDFLAAGYTGTERLNNAAIEFRVDGAVSAGVLPLSIGLATGTTSRVVRLLIQSNGGIKMPSLKSGISQADATAAANELWVDTSAGYVIKRGV